MSPVLPIERKRSDMVAEAEEKPQQAANKEEKQKRSYWSKEVFFTGGYGWGLHLVKTATNDGRRCYDVKHVCLGKEEDVLAMLDDEPMLNTLTPVQREILTKIVDNVGENTRTSKYNDRTERFSFRKRTSRGLRGSYRYSARVER
jgi:hypothetical protein